MQDQKRLAFFLPNIFTALNMACGFIAIMLSLKGDIYKACLFLILGAVFDSVDGRIARLTGTTSAFGEQFDSMSDLTTFGMAPGLVYYNFFLYDMGRVGMVVTFLYILCGALRLARFNANIDKVNSNYFQGIPIPGAAMAVVGLVLFSLEVPRVAEIKSLPAIYLFFYSLLMISNIPFPSFKNSTWVKTHKKQVLLIIFAVLACLFLYEEMALIGLFSLYVVGSLIYFLTHRQKFKGVFHWKDEGEVEE